jgi:hypothetical protein
MTTIKFGEHLHSLKLNLTGMTEYGVSFDEMMFGTIPLPAEGARFDTAFEDQASGSRLNGSVLGLITLEHAQMAIWSCISTKLLPRRMGQTLTPKGVVLNFWRRRDYEHSREHDPIYVLGRLHVGESVAGMVHRSGQ